MKFYIDKSPEIKKQLENEVVQFNNNNKSVSKNIINKPTGEASYISKNEFGVIQAGVSMSWYWGIMHIDYLWVDEALRGKRIGEQLLKLAEEKAISLGCKVIRLETYSFQAPNFYKKFSYEVFGTLIDSPEVGVSLFYLKKQL